MQPQPSDSARMLQLHVQLHMLLHDETGAGERC